MNEIICFIGCFACWGVAYMMNIFACSLKMSPLPDLLSLRRGDRRRKYTLPTVSSFEKSEFNPKKPSPSPLPVSPPLGEGGPFAFVSSDSPEETSKKETDDVLNKVSERSIG